MIASLRQQYRKQHNRLQIYHSVFLFTILPLPFAEWGRWRWERIKLKPCSAALPCCCFKQLAATISSAKNSWRKNIKVVDMGFLCLLLSLMSHSGSTTKWGIKTVAALRISWLSLGLNCKVQSGELPFLQNCISTPWLVKSLEVEVVSLFPETPLL